jgi:hypothetical protein
MGQHDTPNNRIFHTRKREPASVRVGRSSGDPVLEALGIPFSIRRENVLGLKHLRIFDTTPSMRALGIERPLPMDEAVRGLLARP